MKSIVVFILFSNLIFACPSDKACRRLNINVDLKSSLDLGDVVPVDLCHQSQNCEQTSEFISDETKNNCSVKITYQTDDGNSEDIYLKSNQAHEYITKRFQYLVNGFIRNLPIGAYTMRAPAQINDTYACVPIEKTKRKTIKVAFDQRPIHCLNGANADGSDSSFMVHNPFVTRATICRKGELVNYNSEYEGTYCEEHKDLLRAEFNEKVRGTANAIVRQITQAQTTSVSSPLSSDMLNEILTNVSNHNLALVAPGEALVKSLQLHKDLNDNLNAPCATDVCIDCDNR